MTDTQRELHQPSSETVTAAGRSKHSRGLWPVWLGGAVLAAWLIRLRSEPDVDLWLHLRVGKELRAGQWFGVLPDPLTALADEPYRPSQWLAQVGAIVVEQATGIAGIHVLRALAVLAVAALVYLAARVWARPQESAVVAVLTTLGTSAGWGERPQLLGLVLLALAVLLWSRTLVDGRPRWVLVPLSWLWACCHGSWVLGVAAGVVVLVALAVERNRPSVAWRRLTAVVGGSVLAAGVTPLGPALLLDPFRVGATARATVNEWQTPSPGNPLLVLVVLLGVAALGRAARSRDLPVVVLAAAGIVIAASSVRTIAVGALFVAPALARSLRHGEDTPRTRREWLPAVVGGILLLAVPGVVWASPTQGPLAGKVDRAVAALPAGSRVAVDAFASGWVVWAHPEVEPLRDLRVEVYSPPVAQAYETFFRAGPGWQDYADRQEVTALLVRAGEPLDDAAAAGGWRRTAADDRFVLWTRDPALAVP